MTRKDWISISLDSMDEKRCKDIGRAYLSETHLYQLIEACQEYGLNLKINTVVSAVNKDNIYDIGAFLQNNPPDIWKLRQFSARSSGHVSRDKYTIPNAKFNGIVHAVKTAFKSLNIESITETEQDGYCFMVFPNGQIANPVGTGFKLYGNILEEDINRIWKEHFLADKKHFHRKNRVRTYQ
jgi:MoaA/NifB/PqqE/SkfB family radical SAM enzyme